MKKYNIKFGLLEKWYTINEIEIEANSEEEAERIFLENFGDLVSESSLIDQDFIEILDSDPDILNIGE